MLASREAACPAAAAAIAAGLDMLCATTHLAEQLRIGSARGLAPAADAPISKSEQLSSGVLLELMYEVVVAYDAI